MATRNGYIESLDIPDSDKELLREFENTPWEDIWPDRCQSETARKEATSMMRTKRWTAER